MEVVPGVHCIAAGKSPFPGVAPPNVYLVMGAQEAIFIDSGYQDETDVQARLDYLRALGSPPVRAIVLTHRHRDHIGGAPHFHRATLAPVLANSTEKPFIDTALEKAGEAMRVHEAVTEGQELALDGLTLRFLDAPGHTLGSLTVFLPEHRLLFTGDTVLATTTTAIRPEEGDLALYVQTLHRFLDYDLALICPGHGPVVQDPKVRIRALIQHRHEREEQVVAAMRQGFKTVDGLLAHIYRALDSRLQSMARDQLRCHLMKLEREGRVEQQGEEYTLAQ